MFLFYPILDLYLDKCEIINILNGQWWEGMLFRYSTVVHTMRPSDVRLGKVSMGEARYSSPSALAPWKKLAF
jgi:hypothetical protein